jgi:DGQHR domain-containing protein
VTNHAKITALKVRQWLPSWDQVQYDASTHRRKPLEHFYMFSLRASHLRALSGVQIRSTVEGKARSEDLGIQRKHDNSRSEEIHEYVRSGFPWSDLSPAKRQSGEFADLKKPGWLPTAIVINILLPEDSRNGHTVAPSDLLSVEDTEGQLAVISLPDSFSGDRWKFTQGFLPPCEVIDGQHRLGAFTDFDTSDYEIPVVAFYGLDISWQAYLFYTVNIKPKKINASLAYDMYPLLRTEDWLERFQGHSVYRETRAQELTEALWSYPESPWHDRINMLGETGKKGLTQAAWVRSLLATYVRSFESGAIGGLFGAGVGSDRIVLGWNRSQQAALLIRLWQLIRDGLAEAGNSELFAHPSSLLNQDQGVRAVLHVSNDILFLAAGDLSLSEWTSISPADVVNEITVDMELSALMTQPAEAFLSDLADSLARFDWRSFAYPGLPEPERSIRAGYRGSGGYLALRKAILSDLAGGGGQIAQLSGLVKERLSF